MAVERGIGAGGLNKASPAQEEAEVDFITMPEDPSVMEMDDGSVIVGEITQEVSPIDIPFEANLAEFIENNDLMRISSDLVGDIEEDMSSRKDWEDTYKRGIDLLGMEYDDRTQPFEGATGVVHPLLSESVTQFQAQAYREMLPSGGPVRTQIVGAETPEVAAQAERVKHYMNYMLTYEMEEYDPETDQMLFYLPIVGSTFKKVYNDPLLQRPVSKFVHAEDLLVPYGATDLLTSPRITHIIRMDSNEIRKMQVHAGLIELHERKYIHTTNVDITEREHYERMLKDANRKLAEERQRLDEIIWGTSAGTWEWNVQTGETRFNERWAEIIGYTLDELGPVSIDTWLAYCHPEDLEKSDAALQSTFRGETDHYQCECRMRHKDGSWVWVLDRGKVVEWDADGNPLRMSGTHADITPTKAVEAEIRRLAQTDQLTGLSNRYQFNSMLSQIIQINRRFEKSIVLLLLYRAKNCGRNRFCFYVEGGCNECGALDRELCGRYALNPQSQDC